MTQFTLQTNGHVVSDPELKLRQIELHLRVLTRLRMLACSGGMAINAASSDEIFDPICSTAWLGLTV